MRTRSAMIPPEPLCVEAGVPTAGRGGGAGRRVKPIAPYVFNPKLARLQRGKEGISSTVTAACRWPARRPRLEHLRPCPSSRLQLREVPMRCLCLAALLFHAAVLASPARPVADDLPLLFED